MKDWVDIDLDRELARIERENAREEAIEKHASELIQHSADAAYGRMLRAEALIDNALYDAIYEAFLTIATREIDKDAEY